MTHYDPINESSLLKYVSIIEIITEQHYDNIDAFDVSSNSISFLTTFIAHYHGKRVKIKDSVRARCEDEISGLLTDKTLNTLKRIAEIGNGQIDIAKFIDDLDQILAVLMKKEDLDTEHLDGYVINNQVCTCLKIIKIISKFEANRLVKYSQTFNFILRFIN